MNHEVSLVVGDPPMRIDTWDRYDLTIDMLQPGSPWTASLWRSDTRDANWTRLRAVRLYDPVTWLIDGATVVSGRVETRRVEGKRTGALLVLSGRDASGPALDWDADPTVRLRGLTLAAALEALFAPLGIPVVIGASADGTRLVQVGTRRGPRGVTRSRRTRPIDIAHPRPGERVWQLADAIVRRAGYLLWIAPSEGGGLAVVVDTPGYGSGVRYRLERRAQPDAPGGGFVGNILSGAEDLNGRDAPSVVNVYTHATRGDAVSARQRATVANAGLADAAITRGLVRTPLPVHPRHVRADRARTVAAAQREGERVLANAMARFRAYSCTVQGHGQPTTSAPNLFAVNTMAHVHDDLCLNPSGAPLDEDMLVTRVAFSGGGRTEGQTTTLALGPRSAIVVTPEDG